MGTDSSVLMKCGLIFATSNTHLSYLKNTRDGSRFALVGAKKSLRKFSIRCWLWFYLRWIQRLYMTKETARPAQSCALIDYHEDAGNCLPIFLVLHNHNAFFKIMTNKPFFKMGLQAIQSRLYKCYPYKSYSFILC